MTCRSCTGHHPVRLQTFPAWDPRASLTAAPAAAEERSRTGAPVHVHYDAIHDSFAVIRTDAAQITTV
ncbi:hypothetical protein [Streptomyces sp. NPDC005507]|uniref:hypothetical protein n=1 Tax=Streptomyces sp. NPDC005507 TaxID=3154885 RepID=UPI0033AEB977